MYFPLFNLSYIRLLLLTTFLTTIGSPAHTFAENLFQIQSEYTEITIQSMESYSWEHEIMGGNMSENEYGMTISIPETAELKDISLEVTSNGKTKKYNGRNSLQNLPLTGVPFLQVNKNTAC